MARTVTTQRSRGSVLKRLVKVAIILYIIASLLPRFIAQNAGAQGTERQSSYDPRIVATIVIRALQSPAPTGCAVIGGWEDGSIVAHCIDAQPAWIAIGPDVDDAWTAYEGPIAPIWQDRVACLDGGAPVIIDCETDPILRFLHARTTAAAITSETMRYFGPGA